MCNSSLTLNRSKHTTSYLHPISQLKLCHTVYMWQYGSMSMDNHIGHVIPTCLDTMNYCQVEADLWSCIVVGKSRWMYAKVSKMLWNARTVIMCEVLFHINFIAWKCCIICGCFMNMLSRTVDYENIMRTMNSLVQPHLTTKLMCGCRWEGENLP